MVSGHNMIGVAPNQVVLHYGVGCSKGGICFKCLLPECKGGSLSQGHREVVNEKEVVTWLDEAENLLSNRLNRNIISSNGG